MSLSVVFIMTKTKLTIIKGSNFFKVRDFDNDIKEICYQFTRRFIQLKPNNSADGAPAMTVFAAALKDRTEFRFHINSFDSWMRLLSDRNIKGDLIKIVELPPITVQEVDLPFRDGWVARDYQEKLIKYLEEDNNPKTDNKFIGLSMGMGKGFISIKALSELKMRTLIIVRPVYIQKWVKELHQMLDIPIESIMVIQGSKHFQTFLEMCLDNTLENNRIGILSNRTYQNWLKAYEEFGDDIDAMGYPFNPDQLFEMYKAGIRLIDEVHQDFHLNFKCDLYTHTHKCISLSATLDSNDPSTRSMYELAYPHRSRADTVQYEKYIDAFAVSYYLQEDRHYRTTEYGQNNYSHIAFEKSIIRNKEFLDSYLRMIKDILNKGYIQRRKPGQKAIIFASSIAMCDKITDYLRKELCGLDVKRFCEDDPVENLHNADITVSNMIKGATGHDIKNLICTILTIAVDSLQANLQCFGRLRKIDAVDTEFYYLLCQDIQKHKNYHKNKIDLLKPRSKTFTEMQYPKRI